MDAGGDEWMGMPDVAEAAPTHLEPCKPGYVGIGPEKGAPGGAPLGKG